MYKYYLDFLKSFKIFLGDTFPSIQHYQFNYADKAYLNYKLYNQHVQEYPLCIVNITDLQTEDNAAFMRAAYSQYSGVMVQAIASNLTRRQTIVMDFKRMIIQLNVRINVNNLSDLLNFHNELMSRVPKDFTFYAYNYNSYINIDDYIDGWKIDDDTNGLYYRAVNQNVEAFALYNIEPSIKIQSVTKNKTQDDMYLDIGIEVRLSVPNAAGTNTINDSIIDGIQIIVEQGDSDLPILIDMDNDIISDRKDKLVKTFILHENNFDKECNCLNLPYLQYKDYINHHVVVYTIDDLLNIKNGKATILYTSIYITDDLIIDDINVPDDESKKLIRIILHDDISSFSFSQFSKLELYIFE